MILDNTDQIVNSLYFSEVPQWTIKIIKLFLGLFDTVTLVTNRQCKQTLFSG